MFWAGRCCDLAVRHKHRAKTNVIFVAVCMYCQYWFSTGLEKRLYGITNELYELGGVGL